MGYGILSPHLSLDKAEQTIFGVQSYHFFT